MATQVRISPDGEILITFDAEDVVFGTPLADDDIDMDDVDLDDDDIEDVEDEDEQD